MAFERLRQQRRNDIERIHEQEMALKQREIEEAEKKRKCWEKGEPLRRFHKDREDRARAFRERSGLISKLAEIKELMGITDAETSSVIGYDSIIDKLSWNKQFVEISSTYLGLKSGSISELYKVKYFERKNYFEVETFPNGIIDIRGWGFLFINFGDKIPESKWKGNPVVFEAPLLRVYRYPKTYEHKGIREEVRMGSGGYE